MAMVDYNNEQQVVIHLQEIPQEEQEEDYEHVNNGQEQEEGEEEEEEDYYDDDDDIEEDVYHLHDDDDDSDYYINNHFIPTTTEEEEEDEQFYLANRTFYTTCHKISRQNSPSYKKRPPYTFLENWLIHTLFSKSQQILLRFPVIHPKVMMTEGDFIYTPHQMVNHEQDEVIDEEEEGILLSASAPDASQFMSMDDIEEEQEDSYAMDENMWMSNNSNPRLTLHVMNPDQDQVVFQQPQSNNNAYSQQLHSINEEEEEDEEEEEEKEQEDNIISHEIINWYRTTTDNTSSLVVMETASNQEEESEDEEEVEKSNSRHSIESYQSLSEITEDQVEHQTVNYGTLLPQHHVQKKKISTLMQLSVCFADAAWVAMDLAESFFNQNTEKKSISGFINCLFKIVKVLFLGIENTLGLDQYNTTTIV